MPPIFLAAARATTAVPPGSTACASAACPCSEKGVAVRFSPGCGSAPACADAAPTVAGRAARGRASISGEIAPPPAASKCGRRPVVGLLFAYITGPDLRRISDPDLVPQILDQLNEPLTVARSFHADQHRCSQLLIELLGLTPGMH